MGVSIGRHTRDTRLRSTSNVFVMRHGTPNEASQSVRSALTKYSGQNNHCASQFLGTKPPGRQTRVFHVSFQDHHRPLGHLSAVVPEQIYTLRRTFTRLCLCGTLHPDTRTHDRVGELRPYLPCFSHRNNVFRHFRGTDKRSLEARQSLFHAARQRSPADRRHRHERPALWPALRVSASVGEAYRLPPVLCSIDCTSRPRPYNCAPNWRKRGR